MTMAAPSRLTFRLPARRLRAAFGTALLALFGLLYLQLVILPQLDTAQHDEQQATRQLHAGQEAQALSQYAPLAERLQRPLPAGAQIVAALQYSVAELKGKAAIADVTYNLAAPRAQTLGTAALAGQVLDLSLTVGSDAAPFQLWRNLQAALPCELVITGLTLDGTHPRQAHMTLLLLGAPS